MWSFTSTVSKEMNNLPRLPWFSSGIELRLVTTEADSILTLDTSCGCLKSRQLKLQLSRVPVAGYELRLNLSYGWLEFRRLDMGCIMADLSFGSLIRVTADYILRLIRVLAAGYDLRLIQSCGWLRVAADSVLRLTRVSQLDLTYTLIYQDLFCKIHHFYGLFSTDWFQLPLIQTLAAASITLKKLEQASRP